VHTGLPHCDVTIIASLNLVMLLSHDHSKYMQEGKGELHRAGTSLLAIAIWTGVTFAAPQVQHLNAYADDNNTSAYNKRLADTQKRRELLTQA